MEATLGHAIVGCGRVAPNHADGFKTLSGWNLIWACDRDISAARHLADRFDIPNVTASIADVLTDKRVTSVSVAVDHAQHALLSEQALTAGKHVLVEKPLALSRQDGDSLVSLAKATGRVLSVVSQHRHDPLVTAMRRWLRDEVLGRLRFINVSLEAHRESAYYSQSYWRGTWIGEGGSALINQGYHLLDVVRFLCGEIDVKAAIADRSHLGDVIETDDTLSALLTAGRTPITLNVTVASATTWRSRLEFVGSEGSVCFDLDHPASLHHARGNPKLERSAADYARASQAESAPGIDYYGASHRRQIAEFADAVRWAHPLIEPPDAAVEMITLVEKIYAACNRVRAGTGSSEG